MVIALGDIYAQIQRRDEVRELMRATQERMRGEPGCAYYAFAETLDDPGHFVVVQEWSDQAALDDHYRSRAFADYQAQIAQLLVRSSDLRVHAVQTSARPVDSAAIDISQDEWGERQPAAELMLDAEATLREELERAGASEYYAD